MISFKESKVKEAVKNFLEIDGYNVYDEFSVGPRADIAAFKWIDNYDLECKGVECKGKVYLQSLIKAARTQAKALQNSFPYVYLASFTLKSSEERNSLKSLLKPFRLGYLEVDRDGNVTEVQGTETSLSLSRDSNQRVKQRATVLCTYTEVFGKNDTQARVGNQKTVWCFKKEPVNFCMGIDPGFLPTNGCHLGLWIEQKPNVEKVFKDVDADELYKYLTLIDGYLRVQYIHRYKPREISWILLYKRTGALQKDQVRNVLDAIRRKDWKVRFAIHKEIWGKMEFLGKSEYVKRVEDARKEFEPLRQFLERVPMRED